jgi:transcriptional regulator with XRE-family HTH domain
MKNFAERNSNPLLGRTGTLRGMAKQGRTARQIVAENVRRLMDGSVELDTQDKLADKAGLTQRTISNLLRPETTDMSSPKLDTVESVAHAFGLKPWALLVDPEDFGREMSALLTRPHATDGRLNQAGIRPANKKISQSGKAANPVHKSKAAITGE